VDSGSEPSVNRMTQSVWKSYEALRTHDFGDGFFLNVSEPGQLFVCQNCYRGFKYDARSHRTWAVGTDKLCSALDGAVNARWLTEPCAGGPTDLDRRDSTRSESLDAYEP
jgi:hypothetical protein